jgi:phage shock protein C
MKKSQNRVLLGVCGGLAEFFGIDPLIIRLIFIGLSIWTQAPMIIAYLILAFVLPS